MTAVAEGEDHPPTSQLMTALLFDQDAGSCDVVVQKHPTGTYTSPKEHVQCEEVSWPNGTTRKNLVKKRMCVSNSFLRITKYLQTRISSECFF